MTQLAAKVQWPTAAVLIAMLAGSVAIFLGVEHDRAAALVGWNMVCGLVLARIPSIIGSGEAS
jgi:hypothetical protein